MPAKYLSLYRLTFGSIVFISLGIQLVASCILSDFSPLSFFSYFTVISNILAGFILLFLSLSKKKHSKRFESLRGAVTSYMAITGLVYWGLLHRTLIGSIEWINLYAHGVMPIVVFLDWIISPPKTKLSFLDVRLWLLFPLFYLLYTMIRGSLVGWYPYPFLIPSSVHGYSGVILYSLGILITIFLLSLVLIFLADFLQKNNPIKSKRMK